MAIVAILFGGFAGFVSFVTALLVYDASFLQALWLYTATGACIAAALLTFSISAQKVMAYYQTLSNDVAPQADHI